MKGFRRKRTLERARTRLREAFQVCVDARDKQLEAYIAAEKLEHLQEDTRRAKKAGKNR